MVCLKKNLYDYETLSYSIVVCSFLRVGRKYGSECQVVYGEKTVSLIEVLNELSEKSDYEFFYNDNEVKGVKVSVSVKDATVSEILDHVLQGTALKYQIVDHVIVISPQKDEQAQEKGVWRVSGIVKDQHGVPLPGVTIILKGSSTGTATDASGKFKMHFIDEMKQ